jgi:hypothetical protein
MSLQHAPAKLNQNLRGTAAILPRRWLREGVAIAAKLV